MAAQHQSIMRHVLAFLEKAAEDEWDMDFAIEKWQGKENEDAIKEIIKPTTKTSTKIKDPNMSSEQLLIPFPFTYLLIHCILLLLFISYEQGLTSC